MAACGMCAAEGKKLHKRWYMEYKVYVCIICALNNKKELVNGYSENASSRS